MVFGVGFMVMAFVDYFIVSYASPNSRFLGLLLWHLQGAFGKPASSVALALIGVVFVILSVFERGGAK